MGKDGPGAPELQHSQPAANSTRRQPLPEPGDSHADIPAHPAACPAENWSEPFPTRPLPPPQGAWAGGRATGPGSPERSSAQSRGAGHTHLPSVHPTLEDSMGQCVFGRKLPARASRRHRQAHRPPGLTSCFPLPSPSVSPLLPLHSPPPYPRGHASGPQRHLKLQTAPTPSFNEHVSPVMTVAPARVSWLLTSPAHGQPTCRGLP